MAINVFIHFYDKLIHILRYMHGIVPATFRNNGTPGKAQICGWGRVLLSFFPRGHLKP